MCGTLVGMGGWEELLTDRDVAELVLVGLVIEELDTLSNDFVRYSCDLRGTTGAVCVLDSRVFS